MDTILLAQQLNVPLGNSSNRLNVFNAIRKYFFQKFCYKYRDIFQSPSIEPNTVSQRAKLQNVIEHSVYQRADFTPTKTESKFNKMYPTISEIIPKTLFFNSGMATISTLSFFLRNTKKLQVMYLGENAYFETKWLFDDYGNIIYFNEYKPVIKDNIKVLWLEYPVNCTKPWKYPFHSSIDLRTLCKKLSILCNKQPNRKRCLVIDYTLYYLPFEIANYFDEIPSNLSIYLITSLQKHRNYGLDMINAGALTFYSKDKEEYEYFKRLRAILGTSITQEMLWLFPQLQPKIINQIILDSGINARDIYLKIKNVNSCVKVYYSLNKDFLTSFIFLKVNDELMRKSKKPPFFSDILIEEIIKSARRNNAIIIHGTSFGFPFTRIFKNSERYHNSDSLRIAIGYDTQMNKNVDLAIIEGVQSFSKKVSK